MVVCKNWMLFFLFFAEQEFINKPSNSQHFNMSMRLPRFICKRAKGRKNALI